MTGTKGGGRVIPPIEAVRPFFGSEKNSSFYIQYVAMLGMPSTAVNLAFRHHVHFNPKTIRRWSRADSPIRTFALLYLEQESREKRKARRKAKV